MPDNRPAVALERRFDEIEALVEQRLARSLSPQDRQASRGERRGGDGLDPAPHGKSDPLLDRRPRHEVERVGDGAGGAGRDRPRVALVLEPPGGKTGEVDRREARDGDAGTEEIVGDEAAERRPDSALVFRHDGGVGNRQSERMAKERDDGEPVGACSHHARFRERAEIGRPGPGRRRPTRQEIDRGHHDKQHRGDRAHPAQLGPLLRLGLDEVRISGRDGLGRGWSKLCHRSGYARARRPQHRRRRSAGQNPAPFRSMARAAAAAAPSGNRSRPAW